MVTLMCQYICSDTRFKNTSPVCFIFRIRTIKIPCGFTYFDAEASLKTLDLGICQEPTKIVLHSPLKDSFTCGSFAALQLGAERVPWSFRSFSLQMPANAS